MKVYIPQLPTRYDRATDTRVPSIDLNKAALFGELTVITVQPTPMEDAMEQIQAVAGSITPDDLILAVGDVALLVATAAIACRATGIARILRWDKQKQDYDIVEVEID